MTSVRGKTAIVTGGARGIGFQFCRQLLLNGAKAVAFLDVLISEGEASAKSLNEEFGEGRAFFFFSDVTKFDEFNIVFKKATETLQGLDILINNAGILNERNWKKMVEVNTMAVINSTLVAYEYMGKHNGGQGGIIVNVSSVLGLVQSVNVAPVYTATKHAIVGFTLCLKHSYETTGISVRVICPGFTETNLSMNLDGEKYQKFVKRDAANWTTQKLSAQPAERVGETLIDAIEKGENGSVWVTQLSEKPFEIEVAKYEGIKFA